MIFLFSPAVRLMQRMRLLPKFGLVGLLFVLPLLLVCGLLFGQMQRSIDDTGRQREGLHQLRATMAVQQLLLQHRALHHLGLAGAQPAMERAAALRPRLAEAIGALDTEALREFGADQLLADIRKKWSDLEAGLPDAKAKESYAAHSAMMTRLTQLATLLAEHSGLTLDSEFAVHHLARLGLVTLPELASAVSDLAGRGAAYIDTGLQEPGEDLLLSSTVMISQRTLAQLPAQIDVLIGAAPALAPVLTLQQDVLPQAEAFLSRTRNEVLNAYEQTNGMAFIDAGLDAAGGLQQATNAAAEQLELQLAQRVQRQNRHRALIAAGVAAALAVAAWLLAGFTLSFRRDIAALEQAVARAARGDLGARADTQSRDEIGHLAGALGEMNLGLTGLVRQVRGGSVAICSAAAEIASGNADLSTRTEAQASALQQTVTAMEELTAAVQRNSDGAAEANRLTLAAASVADQGSAAVDRVVASMAAVKASSRKVIDIVRVIDELAFQTNLLALNAAVEAARAGIHGRGFAVVAAEVRALAQRSAQASHEIRDLIDDAVQETDRGNTLVVDAGNTMRELLAAVRRVAHIMQDISDASVEQAAGITQVSQAIGQVDDLTQRNAALVEQAAQAAGALHEQANHLLQSVAVFRLGDQHSAEVMVSEPNIALPAPAQPVVALRGQSRARPAALFAHALPRT